MVVVRSTVMSICRPWMRAWVAGAAITLVPSLAFAQYCDPRFNPSCRGYPPRTYPPQAYPPEPYPSQEYPQPYGRTAPLQPRYQPPEPAPRYEPTRPGPVARPLDPALGAQYAALYAPVQGEPHPVPGVRLSDIDPEFLRRTVSYPTHEPPGTIVIDAHNH